MIEYIIIPTLGRMDNQITYNNLPDLYKDITKFVVQSHEYDEMFARYGDKVICLPDHIDRIATTREWIFNQFKHTRHFVFDDDLNFTIKVPNKEESGPKWKSRDFNDDDFCDMFELITNWMDEGIVFGGLGTTWVIPNVDLWPYAENTRVMTNTFYDGPNIPDNIEWTRVPAAEDFDVTLQLLTQGYKNRVCTHYMVSPSETNADGGCSVWRTLEVHNQSQIKLAELWPDYVKVKEKELKSGPWKGKTKLTTIIQHKKAYNSSLTKTENTLF